MDVLFNSIDVRDLLSSHDLDESSPLSVPDLRLLIDRLQVRSLHIKSKVQQYILTHHQDFADLFSKCSDTIQQFENLSDQVSDLVGLISGHPIDAEIRDIVQQIGRQRIESREKKALLELVRGVVELSEKMRFVKEDMKAGRVVEAAEALRQLKTALRVRDNATEEEGEPVVYYGLLRKEWNECFEEIQEVLMRLMEKAVRFEQQSDVVHVKYRLALDEIHWVELQTVLKAMDVIGILDYGLAKVADLMIKYVIAPAVTSGSFSSSVDKITQDSEDIVEVFLRIFPSTLAELEDLNGENIYSALIQVVKFIFDFICFGDSSRMRCFGRLTWPRMSELIISNFLSKVVPNEASKLTDFQKIRELTANFEMNLKEMRFISTPDGKGDKLSDFADNVEVHFASRKKVAILAKARNLLLHSDFVLPQGHTRKSVELRNEANAEIARENVVDLLFSSDKCVISGAAAQLLELVHQTLKDICLSSSRVALEFYYAARDALLLYEAVIPVKSLRKHDADQLISLENIMTMLRHHCHDTILYSLSFSHMKLERQLDGINQVAVLIHNDCLYLSQEILGFAFEYRPDFPSSIKDAVFIDLGTRYQLMAEEILQRQIQLVIRNLIEAIDGADGFQNTHQTKQFESAKFSIDQVVFILEKVRMIWEPLLLPLTYKRSMCTVLEAVFSRMTKDILLLDDMVAEETLQLQRLVHLMLEYISSLLESLVAINQTEKPEESTSQSVDALIPSLHKIRKLADLLDMPLKSITAAWESGELVSCGFTSSEVEDFIRAIFTDSPLRKECLWRIEDASFQEF